MNVEVLREAIGQQPFVPFSIRLADGRAISVHHHDFEIVHPNGRTVVAFLPNGGMNVIDVMLITDLKYDPKQEATNSLNTNSI